MLKIGFVGWRGMVGSVLLQRMEKENDWPYYPNRVFYSSTEIEEADWPFGQPVEDSFDISSLSTCDIIVSCQGSEWTKEVYLKLRNSQNWKGIFIDASSALRTDPESTIVLDPVNRKLIDRRIKEGCKAFVGGNCTTSLMLMALQGLFKEGLVESVDSSTYQAVSGAGAECVEELLSQVEILGRDLADWQNVSCTALEQMDQATSLIHQQKFPKEKLGAPLLFSLFPWIDSPLFNGQTKEEGKMLFESLKILGLPEDSDAFKADCVCVRVGSLRCHSQSLRIGLRQQVPLDEVKTLLENNPFVSVVANEEKATKQLLTPASVSGSLNIKIGRLRYSEIYPKTLTAFTVGDQLLWGAAEPIRRILRIVNGLEP